MAAVEPAQAVLTWRDLATASRHRAVRSRVWVLLVPLCLLAVAMVVVSDAALARLLGVFLALVIATIPLWGPTTATWMQARHRVWPTSTTSWAVEAAGLSVQSEPGTSTVPWAIVTDVSSWRGGVTLTCGRAALVIPGRAFAGAGHREAFVAAVRASTSPPAS